MTARDRPEDLIAALRRFLTTPLESLLPAPGAGDGGAAALALFRETAAEVPAYAQFLADHGVDPAGVRSMDDFRRLPLTSKANYVNRYALAERCRAGRIESCDMVAVSSGSTGEPTFWPRGLEDELSVALRFEQVFKDGFAAERRSTLAVVCFALGTWVGGLYTLSCCRLLAAKGYPILAAAPGNNRAEIWRVVRRLAPAFEQTVLLGYPPFLKEVIDGGRAEGIDWRRFRVKLVMAGEVFSEEWRALVAERLGMAEPITDAASLYGTADAGVLGTETPLSVTIRRFFAANPEAARQMFGESRLPTLVQYDPFHRYFEAEAGTLLFTGRNGVPLIRYHIADSGGLIAFDALFARLAEWGVDPVAKLASLGAPAARILPFAYVFGRADFTVSFFGANIYPENVAVALEQPQVAPLVTGKFVLQAKEGLDQAPHLFLVVELAPGATADPALCEGVAEAVLEQLLRLNSEFAAYTPPEFRRPRVELKANGDREWFPTGVKHRYTRR